MLKDKRLAVKSPEETYRDLQRIAEERRHSLNRLVVELLENRCRKLETNAQYYPGRSALCRCGESACHVTCAEETFEALCSKCLYERDGPK